MSFNFQEMLKKAEAGDIDAQHDLASAYYWAEDIAENHAEASRWYRKAADNGHAASAFRLGRMYIDGEIPKTDPREAARWFTKALACGLELQEIRCISYTLADVFYYGRCGVLVDHAEAFRWYRVAAEGGIDYAMVKLGMMYAAGEGVKKDDVEAARWYREAANLDEWDGWYKLGMCYKDGVGVEKDFQEAEKWLLLAAGKGHEDAQYALGLMIANEEAVEDCGCDEVYWLGMAADKGHVMAQFALGEIYESRESYASAYAWYRIVESHGNAQAASKLQLLVPRMSPKDILSGQIDHAYLLVQFAKSAAWKASEALRDAQRKHANALENEGDCYFYGRGVPKDYGLAYISYREAARHGSSMALYHAGLCCLKREEPYRNEMEAYAYWSLALTIHGFVCDELAKLEEKMSPDDRARGQEIANMIREDIEANKLGG